MDVIIIAFEAPTGPTSQKVVSAAGEQQNTTNLASETSLVTPSAQCFMRAGAPGSFSNINQVAVPGTVPAAVAVDGTDVLLLANNTYRIRHAFNTRLGFAGAAAFNVFVTPILSAL